MRFPLLVAVLLCVTPVEPSQTISFDYSALDAFARAQTAIAAGATPIDAMTSYVKSGTPVFQAFAGRHGITPESMVKTLERWPRYSARLARIRPRVEAQESTTRRFLDALTAAAAPGATPVPVHYLVGNHTAGGTPVATGPPGSGITGIGVALDVIAMDDEVDLSEFPGGIGGRQALVDVPLVVVHEMVHVYQTQAQGLANYRSIYADGPGKGDNLAIALREGCADYLTLSATGRMLGTRHLWGAAREDQLWAEFQKIMHAPGFSTPGWFDAGTSDRPMQIGYWMGLRICQTYVETAPDSRAAVRDVYGAYRPEHFRRILAPYAAGARPRGTVAR